MTEKESNSNQIYVSLKCGSRVNICGMSFIELCRLASAQYNGRVSTANVTAGNSLSIIGVIPANSDNKQFLVERYQQIYGIYKKSIAMTLCWCPTYCIKFSSLFITRHCLRLSNTRSHQCFHAALDVKHSQ